MDQPTGPTNTENVPDTGDVIDPHAHDPEPQAVEDPSDPSYVEPAHAAVRVDATRMVPPGDPGTRMAAPGDDPERDPEGHA